MTWTPRIGQGMYWGIMRAREWCIWQSGFCLGRSRKEKSSTISDSWPHCMTAPWKPVQAMTTRLFVSRKFVNFIKSFGCLEVFFDFDLEFRRVSAWTMRRSSSVWYRAFTWYNITSPLWHVLFDSVMSQRNWVACFRFLQDVHWQDWEHCSNALSRWSL
jgi:hypothetical protein